MSKRKAEEDTVSRPPQRKKAYKPPGTQRKPVSKGTCFECNKTMNKTAFIKHVPCTNKSSTSKEAIKRTVYLIYLEVERFSEYFMYVEVDGSITINQFDAFLRKTWLNKGHLSEFIIGGEDYKCVSFEKYPKSEATLSSSKIDKGDEFSYTFDFGTSTDISGHIVKKETRTDESEEKIIIVGRNVEPAWKCESCDKNIATHVCVDCFCELSGWLCKDCLSEHECDEERIEEKCNKPRTGWGQ